MIHTADDKIKSTFPSQFFIIFYASSAACHGYVKLDFKNWNNFWLKIDLDCTEDNEPWCLLMCLKFREITTKTWLRQLLRKETTGVLTGWWLMTRWSRVHWIITNSISGPASSYNDSPGNTGGEKSINSQAQVQTCGLCDLTTFLWWCLNHSEYNTV